MSVAIAPAEGITCYFPQTKGDRHYRTAGCRCSGWPRLRDVGSNRRAGCSSELGWSSRNCSRTAVIFQWGMSRSDLYAVKQLVTGNVVLACDVEQPSRILQTPRDQRRTT
ncbi:hypothetical protein Tamer19_45300 [Cupriavidus sp. TA19]|nr:hypothetical protein Tamer19_45300 [Cupriavidus sp. TA19]